MDSPPRVEQQTGGIPSARFGHTTTLVGNNKVIVFGGAVGDAGHYNITADTYICDLVQFRWSKIHAEKSPQARAAHAAACVDAMQLVIFGGATGGGSLSSDELYLLDLRKEPYYSWMAVPTTGGSPGRRYGHTMVYHRPNLIVFGGNDGQQTINDVWFMDVEISPFCWTEVEIAASLKIPPPRVYHSAEVCREGPANGMMVIFGGRSPDSKSLRDTWGLRQHRDGQWDWVEAPTKRGTLPEARYQHSAAFIGSKMLIIGGRTVNDCTRELQTATYDTEMVEWRLLHSIGRFRHSSWVSGMMIFAFGGFSHQTQQHPLADLLSLDCSVQLNFYNEKEPVERKRIQLMGLQRLPSLSSAIPPPTASTALMTATPLKTKLPAPTIAALPSATPTPPVSTPSTVPPPSIPFPPVSPLKPSSKTPFTNIRLSTHAHAVQDDISDFSTLVRRVSIDRLEEEGRRLNFPAVQNILSGSEASSTETSLPDAIISTLLNPGILQTDIHAKFNPESQFCIQWTDVSRLCDEVLAILKEEEIILTLRTPIKIYGDIHGQYYDLMRLFELYKSPVDEDMADELEVDGDVDSNDYLFLGDFVDRGSNSLEIICLLFALKCKYRNQIHLIRGNHEDPEINCVYGFQDECRRRLREDPQAEASCWAKFNKAFEWLPVAALIEEKILCLHGGIGGSIQSMKDIATIMRPLKVAQVPSNEYEQCVTDLLWSDPTDNDSIMGVISNDVRDPDGVGHIVKFGPDRVHKFLADNDLQLIIRAHECVMDGFERFAGGKLITLFSATNYCNHHQNAGALLFIRRDMTVVPKLIFPANVDVRAFNTWDYRMTENRPPTPPRSHPRMKERNFGAPE